MFKVTLDGKAHLNAVELLFDGVTSEPATGVKLLVSRELSRTLREEIKSTLAALLGEDWQASEGAQSFALPNSEVTHFTPPPFADKKHSAQFSKRRDLIQREFITALKAKHIDIMSWNVAEVPLAQFLELGSGSTKIER